MGVNSDSFGMLDISDKNQFTLVYNLYYESLCFFAQRYLGDSEQAEDVVGDLFSKLWRQPTSFNHENHLKAYLYQSVSNACYTYLKANKSVKAREESYTEQIDYTDESFLNNMIRAEVWAEVYRSIENLPTQCALVIKMGYIEGLKNTEIAEKLGISLQTVKNHKLRGLAKLRKTITNNPLYLLILYSLLK